MVVIYLEEPYWTYGVNFNSETTENKISFLTYVFVTHSYMHDGISTNILHRDQSVDDIVFISSEIEPSGALRFDFRINHVYHLRRFLQAAP